MKRAPSIQRAVPLIAVLLVLLAPIALPDVPTQRNPSRLVTVSGMVVNRAEQPMAFVHVYLVHRILGRFYGGTTDHSGFFRISEVAVHAEPYFIELYYGRRLIHRQELPVLAPIEMVKIQLP